MGGIGRDRKGRDRNGTKGKVREEKGGKGKEGMQRNAKGSKGKGMGAKGWKGKGRERQITSLVRRLRSKTFLSQAKHPRKERNNVLGSI